MESVTPFFKPSRYFPRAEITHRKVNSEETKSCFSIIHRSYISSFSLPFYWVRGFLLFNNELRCDGSFHPKKFFVGLAEVSIPDKLVEKILQNTFTIIYKEEPHKITLKELISHYLKLFPNHDVHWIGSSLSLGKEWSTLYLKNANLDQDLESPLSKSFDYIVGNFTDIDIRFMVPPRKPRHNSRFIEAIDIADHDSLDSLDPDYVRLALENLCCLKFHDKFFRWEISAFEPDEKTKTFSFEKRDGDQYDIDLVQCSHKIPPFVTTQEAAYMSFKDYFATGKTDPQFLGGIQVGEYFLHQAAKIFYIPDRTRINPGTFKRFIQLITYGYITPQRGIIRDILQVFNGCKGGTKQFFNVFQKRKAHLDSNPKTELAYCLNLISCVKEFYPTRLNVSYWEQCANLLTAPQKGLSLHIDRYIKEHHEGCGELITVLKTCSLITYATKIMTDETSGSDALYPIYPGTQNGEPYLAMPVSQQTAVHLKLDADKTISDLLSYFDFVANTPSASSEKKSKLVNIFVHFLEKQLIVKLEPNKENGVRDFAFLDIDPTKIQNALSGFKVTDEAVIHALNLIWKSIHHACHLDYCTNEIDIITSLAPGLNLFGEKETQDHLIEFMRSSISSPLVLKILQGLKERSHLNLDEILSVIFGVMGQEEVSTCEAGYQLWREAIKHEKYSEKEKCAGLLKLFSLTYQKRKSLFNKRVDSLLKEQLINPLLLAEQCQKLGLHELAVIAFGYCSYTVDSLLKEQLINPLLLAEQCQKLGLHELAVIAFGYCSYADVKKHPKSLIPLSHIRGKINLQLCCKLIIYLTRQKHFTPARKALQKIPVQSLDSDEISAMSDCANQIINHLISGDNHDLAVQTYRLFVQKELLRNEHKRQWDFLSKLCDRIGSKPAISEELLAMLKSLLTQPGIIVPKLANRIKTTLNHIFRYANFLQKLSILCALNQFNYTAKSKELINFHNHQFKKLVKNSDQTEKFKITCSYLRIHEWTYAAQALIKMSSDDFCARSYQLALIILNQLNLHTDLSLMSDLFLLCQDQMDDTLLIEHLPTVSENTSLSDQGGLLSRLVKRVNTIDAERGLKLLYHLLGLKIQLQNLPLVLSLLQQNVDNPLISWTAYRSVTGQFDSRECREEKIAYLKQIIEVCLLNQDQSELAGEIFLYWGELGVDPSDFTQWIELLNFKLNSLQTQNRVDEIVAFFQILDSQVWMQEHLSDYVETFFTGLIKSFQEHQNVPTDLFYQIWGLFSNSHLKRGFFWDYVREVALSKGDLATAWDLTFKKHLKDEQQKDLQFVLYPINIEELEYGSINSRKWKRLLKRCMNEDEVRFSPSVHKYIYKLIKNHILDISGHIKPKKVVKKAIQWSVVPPDWFNKCRNADDETKPVIDKIGKHNIEILERLAVGIWCLTNESSLRLSSKIIERLNIIGAVFRVMSKRKNTLHKSYDLMCYEYDRLAIQYRMDILKTLKKHPDLKTYKKVIADTIWDCYKLEIIFFVRKHIYLLTLVCCVMMFIFYLFYLYMSQGRSSGEEDC